VHPLSVTVAAATVLLSSSMGLGQNPAQVLPPAPQPEVSSPSAVPESATSAAPALTRSDVEAWLDGLIPNSLRVGDIAGAVVVVVKGGEVLLEKGYGFSDLEKRKPVDPRRTLFRPGSVSKLFTWTAVMQQVEQGRLDLDTDVNQYIDFRIPDRNGKPVTLRNIMTHTPGFEEQYRGLITENDKNVPVLGEHLKANIPERVFDPGTTPAYSNYATALAGYVVERASGMSFDDYLDKFVFAPLDMQHSTFRQPLPESMRADMSLGYPRATQDPKPYEIIGVAPAGSLAAPGGDMAKFMIAHLQNGRYRDNRILKEETARLMHDSALTILPRVHRMLLGFYETNYNGHRVISHGGDTQWFHSDLNLFVDDGIGLFISMNSAGKENASGKIRATFFEEFADRYFPAPVEEGEVDAATAAEHAAMIAGGYDISRRMETTFFSLLGLMGQTKVIVNPDNTITVPLMTNPAGVPLKWREIAPFVWREVGGKQLLTAQVGDGRVTRFSFEPLSAIMIFEPTPGYKSAGWLVPVVVVGLAALLFTTLAWPTAALVRRHYRVAYPLAGNDARMHRHVRIAALVTLTLSILWMVVLVSALSNLALLDGSLDWLFLTLQIVSPLVYFGGASVGVWYAWSVLRTSRSWWAKAWAILLAIGFLALLWVALVYNLIGLDRSY